MSKEQDGSKSRKRKSHTQDEGEKSKSKKQRKVKAVEENSQTSTSFPSLQAKSLDPTLSSLFSTNGEVQINASLLSKAHERAATKDSASDDSDSSGDEEQAPLKHETLESDKAASDSAGSDVEEDDETLSSISDAPSDLDDVEISADSEQEIVEQKAEEPAQKRRRKQKDDFEDLETSYLDKLSRENEKERAKSKPASTTVVADEDNSASEQDEIDEDVDDADDAASSVSLTPPPQHESITAQDSEFEKAQRTVFLGNISLSAISSKSAQKTLKTHLTSFFPQLKSTDVPPSLTSLRFRSTPFATAIPKRAAFAKREVMDATSHSTNAYAVFSSPAVARSAAQHLNGTIVLSRHLRADSVAHPSPVDHHRCVFVGGLSFVDDESNVDKANEESGRSKRSGNKTPADVEEGLWRTFSKCGKVESVRVIRDAKTRVGKGVAYVQFHEEMSVEEALSWDGKKDPPMLPRKMRVSRAKAVKRNKRKVDGEREEGGKGGYVRKLTNQERSQVGRAERLLGKSGARGVVGRGGYAGRGGRERGGFSGRGGFAGRGGRADGGERTRPALGDGIKAPESFVFEGQRARSDGDAGVKMKKGLGKKAKPTKNSNKRAAAFKAKKAKA
ncbi:RNA recognition motif-containing protein 4 [Elsinoe fawcettii]|nr:RNA recognition motif-containing protein 4 [Elsinoe fawcettii]